MLWFFSQGPTCGDVMVIITDNFVQCFIMCDQNEYFVPSDVTQVANCRNASTVLMSLILENNLREQSC